MMNIIIALTMINTIIVNGFTIIQPFITKDWVVATATIAGPLLFGSFAW